LFEDNSAEICKDPSTIAHDGMVSAFSEIWFYFDRDQNGFIEAHDIRQTFAELDVRSERNIDKSVVQDATDGMFLSFCFESATNGE
jgi:Ca2+-binding EF-hand superfamily protein